MRKQHVTVCGVSSKATAFSLMFETSGKASAVRKGVPSPQNVLFRVSTPSAQTLHRTEVSFPPLPLGSAIGPFTPKTCLVALENRPCNAGVHTHTHTHPTPASHTHVPPFSQCPQAHGHTHAHSRSHSLVVIDTPTHTRAHTQMHSKW